MTAALRGEWRVLDVADRHYYVVFACETAQEVRERVRGPEGPGAMSSEEFVEGRVGG